MRTAWKYEQENNFINGSFNLANSAREKSKSKLILLSGKSLHTKYKSKMTKEHSCKFS